MLGGLWVNFNLKGFIIIIELVIYEYILQYPPT